MVAAGFQCDDRGAGAARSPASRSAFTSACRPPGGFVAPMPTDTPERIEDDGADRRIGVVLPRRAPTPRSPRASPRSASSASSTHRECIDGPEYDDLFLGTTTTCRSTRTARRKQQQPPARPPAGDHHRLIIAAHGRKRGLQATFALRRHERLRPRLSVSKAWSVGSVVRQVSAYQLWRRLLGVSNTWQDPAAISLMLDNAPRGPSSAFRAHRPYGVPDRDVVAGAGKRIVPIHPASPVVLGEQGFPTLEHVPFPIDVVDVFRRSSYAGPFADQAVAVGAKGVWFQLGVIRRGGVRPDPRGRHTDGDGRLPGDPVAQARTLTQARGALTPPRPCDAARRPRQPDRSRHIPRSRRRSSPRRPRPLVRRCRR